jgi:hypothetical protein
MQALIQRAWKQGRLPDPDMKPKHDGDIEGVGRSRAPWLMGDMRRCSEEKVVRDLAARSCGMKRIYADFYDDGSFGIEYAHEYECARSGRKATINFVFAGYCINGEIRSYHCYPNTDPDDHGSRWPVQ